MPQHDKQPSPLKPLAAVLGDILNLPVAGPKGVILHPLSVIEILDAMTDDEAEALEAYAGTNPDTYCERVSEWLLFYQAQRSQGGAR